MKFVAFLAKRTQLSESDMAHTNQHRLNEVP